MTLQKAIELNKESYQSLAEHKLYDHADAIKLGIEALKNFKYHRDLNIISFVKQLPGETPEIDNQRSLHHIKEVLASPRGSESGQ